MNEDKMSLILSRLNRHPELKSTLIYVYNYIRKNRVKLEDEASDREFQKLSDIVSYIQYDLNIPLTREERDGNSFLRKLSVKAKKLIKMEKAAQ
jgi:hypothetical protein